jgi:hypothetical protein
MELCGSGAGQGSSTSLAKDEDPKKEEIRDRLIAF